MNNTVNFSRRDFVKLSAMAGLAFPLMGFEQYNLNSFSNTPGNLEVHLFSKHLQFLNYNDMSEVAAEMGFNGLDLTVRPKGHVLPSQVDEDLPKAVMAMKKYGLTPRMMTTNVVDVENKEHRTVLETASKLGITHYRTGWLTYPEDREISQSQNIYGQQFNNLEEFNKELGLIGCYQNHAGNHVGAPIWDLPPILKATKNVHMGCQYDIRHAVVEGGSSWELGLRLIQPFIKSIVIKDFKWGIVKGKWKPVNTPLGEGMVDFDRYFSLLKKYKINVPVSLHLEYGLGGAEHGASTITIDKKEVFKQMKKDLAFVQQAWQKAE
ncbi:twin-arginine translocation signal domain-containing protein [Arenibacter aquaticus]|uniref:Twin-arginine translocation signal domain-containing protein n=1 Tax=Arenibacter aquaticus TaxID=2489054 RepID=A0A3S0AMJ6_9FLAO|nr:TIM barrel protein [Arenibacter aquaticus]RTE53533.1 twin-arginine translocation signal domain-containing protein [Arenibacter aquaticus]